MTRWQQLTQWQPSPKQFMLGMIAILVLAFTVRLGMTVAFVGLGSGPDLSASPDQGEYAAILEQLRTGNGYAKADGTPTARRAPGTIFTLLPAYWATSGSFAAVRLVLITLSSLTCMLVGLAAAWVLGQRAGLMAAFILAMIPGHAYYAMHLLSEAAFGFWFSAAVCLTLLIAKAEKQRIPIAISAGLCWGAAIMTKPQFVLLLPLATLVIPLVAWRAASWRPALMGAVCLTAASAVITPWVVRNATVLDAPGMSTLGGYGLWAGNNELVLNDPAWRGRAMPTSQVEAGLGVKLPEGEAASDAQAKAYATAFIDEHRDDLPRLVAWKLYRLVTPFQRTENRAVYWAQAVSWVLLAPLVMAGFFLAARRRIAEALLWAGPIMVTLAVTVVYFAIIRYRDTLLPAMVPFGALAIDAAWRRLTARSTPAVAGQIKAGFDAARKNRQAA